MSPNDERERDGTQGFSAQNSKPHYQPVGERVETLLICLSGDSLGVILQTTDLYLLV